MPDRTQDTGQEPEILELTELIQEGDPERRLAPESQAHGPANDKSEGGQAPDQGQKEAPDADDIDLKALFDELEHSGGQGELAEDQVTNDELDDFFLSVSDRQDQEQQGSEPTAPNVDEEESETPSAGPDGQERFRLQVEQVVKDILNQGEPGEDWLDSVAERVRQKTGLPQREQLKDLDLTELRDLPKELAELRQRIEAWGQRIEGLEQAGLGPNQVKGLREEMDRLKERLTSIEQGLVDQDQLSKASKELRQEFQGLIKDKAPQFAAQAVREEIAAMTDKKQG